MIAHSRLIQVNVFLLAARDRGDQVERFQDRAGMVLAAAKIVDFPATRVFRDLIDEFRDVGRVDVIADLFSLVAKYSVGAFFQIAADQVTEEAVEFHASMVRAGKAAAPEHAGF